MITLERDLRSMEVNDGLLVPTIYRGVLWKILKRLNGNCMLFRVSRKVHEKSYVIVTREV